MYNFIQSLTFLWRVKFLLTDITYILFYSAILLTGIIEVAMKSFYVITLWASTFLAGDAMAKTIQQGSTDSLYQQRQALAENTLGKGFGPQSPRDIDNKNGSNPRVFQPAPRYEKMNLCNIHFHKNAEHKGGQFTRFAGYGDTKGYGSGFRYSGRLTTKELQPVAEEICTGEYGGLSVGDTIEVHYVFSSADVDPGPSLQSCLCPSIANPQLRVESQVYVLVNDDKALDFTQLTAHGLVNGLHQPSHIPTNTGKPVSYGGSTTGPSFNTIGSPLQVTWSVRPGVAKVDTQTVEQWCQSNVFNEDHAHGVRNLVVNPQLLSPIQ